MKKKGDVQERALPRRHLRRYAGRMWILASPKWAVKRRAVSLALLTSLLPASDGTEPAMMTLINRHGNMEGRTYRYVLRGNCVLSVTKTLNGHVVDDRFVTLAGVRIKVVSHGGADGFGVRVSELEGAQEHDMLDTPREGDARTVMVIVEQLASGCP
jgi:hypothetical protein